MWERAKEELKASKHLQKTNSENKQEITDLKNKLKAKDEEIKELKLKLLRKDALSRPTKEASQERNGDDSEFLATSFLITQRGERLANN